MNFFTIIQYRHPQVSQGYITPEISLKGAMKECNGFANIPMH
jgi:hypothetical protein